MLQSTDLISEICGIRVIQIQDSEFMSNTLHTLLGLVPDTIHLQ